MGETDWGGNWVLFWWVGPCSENPIFSWWLGLCSLLVTYYGGGNEDNGTSFKRSHAGTTNLGAPQPCSRPLLTHASARDSWTLMGKSGSVSCGVTAPFSWVLVCTRFCLCSPSVFSPVLYKFWQLCVGVNGSLLQEGLCHTQVCCTQSPCPCSSPLLTCTSTGHTQTQFCLSLCGASGPGAHKVCLSLLSISGRNGVWF